jgi:hypothetical protein
MTQTLQEYLEQFNSYIVAKENEIGIDLGKHAKERGDERLAIDNNILTDIGRKIAKVFNKSNADGLFGFYSKTDHVSGIFRFFKNNPTIKFITIFPNKRVQFFNDIKGAIIFEGETESSTLVEPLQDIIEV